MPWHASSAGVWYRALEIERSNACICDVSRDISGLEHCCATLENLGLSNFKLDRKNTATMSKDFRSRLRRCGSKKKSVVKLRGEEGIRESTWCNFYDARGISVNVLYRFPLGKANNGFNVNDGCRFVAN